MSIAYRREIDGLRALAVLSVVIYHAEIFFSGHQLLSGGFLGVDIFFVISGFLITSIILKKSKDNSFSYLDFYDRRIRRILPAFITVAIASTVAGYFLLSSDALDEFSGSVLAAMASVSNMFFLAQDSYVAEPSKFKPFLHTWSLAVEEQFYLFFPILFILIGRYFVKSSAYIVLVILFVSFGYAVYASRTSPDAAFFLIFSRIWELGAGALLAFFKHVNNITEKTGPDYKWSRWAPILGLVLILLSLIFLDDAMLHPSEFTLPAIVGTALIIWYAHPQDIVTKILQWKPFVFIGLLSYSFYLWHWPVLVFAKLQTDIVLPSIVWVLISFVFALLSYYLIERPLRYGNKLWSYLFVIFSFFGLIAFHSASVASGGFPSRFGEFAVDLKEQQNDERKNRAVAIRAGRCHFRNADRKLQNNCNSISQDKPNVVIVGDSLAADIYPALATGYKNANIIQFTGAGCSTPKDVLPHCVALWEQIDEFIEQSKDEIDVFFMHGRMIGMAANNLKTVESRLDGLPVVIIQPRYEITPNPRDDLPKVGLTDNSDRNDELLRDYFSLEPFENKAQALERYAKKAGYRIIDINRFVYPNNQEKIFAADQSLNFLDYGHWSANYGEVVGRRLKRNYPTIEALIEGTEQ